MKKLLMIFALIIGLASCGNNENTANANTPQNDRVEVLFFHGKQRCATCMAIENNTREVIDSLFPEENMNGKVVFKTIDISTPEGEALADKYEVTWSSLFVNKWKNGVETRNNLTDFGFGNARTNPVRFKNGLYEKIHESLR